MILKFLPSVPNLHSFSPIFQFSVEHSEPGAHKDLKLSKSRAKQFTISFKFPPPFFPIFVSGTYLPSHLSQKLGNVQPVCSEGDQPWDFFGGNDAKAETPILWPPHAKS